MPVRVETMTSSAPESSHHHGLLLPVTPPYSDVTLRRAFIVWVRCGQLMYQPTCNYFHCLEEMENSTSSPRVSSRQDFDLYVNDPPTSTFLTDYFPDLYKKRTTDIDLVAKLAAYVHDIPVFQVKGFHDIAGLNQISKKTKNILEQKVRMFCAERQITLTKFLKEFKKFINVCNLEFHVRILVRFMLNRNIKSDLVLRSSLPKDFDFLNDFDDTPKQVNKPTQSKISSPKTEINNVKPTIHEINITKFNEFIKNIKYETENINNDKKLNVSDKWNDNFANISESALKINLSLNRHDDKKDFNAQLIKTGIVKPYTRKSRNYVVLNTSADSVKTFFEYHHKQINIMDMTKPKVDIMKSDFYSKDNQNHLSGPAIDYNEFVKTIADLSLNAHNSIRSGDSYLLSDDSYAKMLQAEENRSISLLNSSMLEDQNMKLVDESELSYYS